MKIDWTLDAWNLIIAAIFLFSLWGKLTSMETKVEAMWKHFIENKE